MSEPLASPERWRAQWIWYPGAKWVVNFHFLARKCFWLDEDIKSGLIHISAYSDYKLYVNGQFLGHGPLPAEPRYQSYDTYDIRDYLSRGANVIAVHCYNYGIGTHWRHRGQGGLICQLDAITADGQAISVGSDATWRVSSGVWAPNSPRMYWSAGFMEIFDGRRYDERWTSVDFDDTLWSPCEVLGPHPTRPWTDLVPRDIPLLMHRFTPAKSAERGEFLLSDLHVVGFSPLVAAGGSGIVYAQTDIHVDEQAELVLEIECDDAFVAFLNGNLVLELNYSEEFARTRVWRGKDEYEQVHYGMTGGNAVLRQLIRFRKGPHRLTVVVDQGPGGWGFALALRDPSSGAAVPVVFAGADGLEGHWLIAGPVESTGLNDSIDQVSSSIPEPLLDGALPVDPFQYTQVTDLAMLMHSEQRGSVRSVVYPATINLREGEFCILDMGKVTVGFPELVVRASADATLDIGYSQVFFEDRGIRFSNGGRMKYVDRVYAGRGCTRWQGFLRRAGRYIHVSCRQGEKVQLSEVGLVAIGYPVDDRDSFACSDPLLNDIWRVSRHTTRLLMQQGYQDCLKREQGTLNNSSFNYMSRGAACAFGDTVLARRGLRCAIETQQDDGWFDSHGISSPNSDEFTQCLMWVVWLKDYYMYSGDSEFVRDVFENAEDALRYFGKMSNRYGLLDTRNYPVYRQGQLVYLDDVLGYSDPETNRPYRGGFQGEVFALNLLFFAALEAAGQLASALDLQGRADFYSRKAARLRQACNARFWNDGRGLYAEWCCGERVADGCHPIVQIAALYYGLCDEPKRHKLVVEYLTDELGLPDETKTDYPLATFGFYYYFLEVLFHNGCHELALRLMRTYYGRWLQAGATTFGEYFRLSSLRDKATLDEEYEVHGYGTSAHLHFYSSILGVRPLTAGFRRVLVAPHPGDLQWARGQIASPLGPIMVSWKVVNGAFYAEVVAPAGCAVRFEQPIGYDDCHCTVNGDPVSA